MKHPNLSFNVTARPSFIEMVRKLKSLQENSVGKTFRVNEFVIVTEPTSRPAFTEIAEEVENIIQ